MQIGNCKIISRDLIHTNRGNALMYLTVLTHNDKCKQGFGYQMGFQVDPQFSRLKFCHDFDQKPKIHL